MLHTVLLLPVLGTVSEGILPGLRSGTFAVFPFANEFINLISPTSFILMAALSISKVSLDKYVKVVCPFLGTLFVLLIVLLAIGSLLSY